MSEKEDTYRKIFKSASLFGIVQLSNLLISVVRSKFLAIFIGPAGYGIFGLLTSTIDLIRQGTGFSLEVSGVKKIAESCSVNDTEGLGVNASVLIRLSIITGIIGVVAAVLLSPFLSEWTFGNSSKVTAFILISVSILFRQITGSQNAVLQGVSKLKYLAKANLWGNFLGLVVTLPLYYFFKIDAIVPSIIITSAISVGLSTFYYKKSGISIPKIGFGESVKKGKEILFFGGLLSVSAFLPVLSNYLIQLFINSENGLVQVGLFNVGLVIVNTYVGIVFNAMSTEYYPRLSGMGKDNQRISDAVNQQAILSMLIIIPVIVLFLGCSAFIIKLLFSERFSGAMSMTSWLVAAMFFKAVSWSMGYVIIAKADSKVFVKTSIIFNIIYLVLCLVGYNFYGLEGLGIGLLVYYILHMITIYIITYYRYTIRLSLDLYKIFGIGVSLCLMSVLLDQFSTGLFRQAAFLMLFVISGLFSFKEIDKRVDIKSIFIKFKNKIIK